MLDINQVIRASKTSNQTKDGDLTTKTVHTATAARIQENNGFEARKIRLK